MTSMPLKLSIVFPAFNEEKRLPPTLDRVLSYLATHYRENHEIVVVNDGSRDSTALVVEEYRSQYPQIRLLEFSQNRGYGAAVREGVMSAKGEYILAMDADGSVHEEAIIRFLMFLQANPDFGFAVGSRTIDGTKILARQPVLRILLGHGFLAFAKLLFGWPMEDRINGFKMFRRSAAEDIFPYQREDGVLGAAEVVYVGERRGWKYQLLPVLWTDYRDSKVRFLREPWRCFVGMIKILRRDREGEYFTGKEAEMQKRLKIRS